MVMRLSLHAPTKFTRFLRYEALPHGFVGHFSRTELLRRASFCHRAILGAHVAYVKRICILITLFCTPFFGQAVRWDIGYPGAPGAATVSASGAPFFALPNVQLNWCSYPSNSGLNQACTNFATTYTDVTLSTACPTNQQVVLQNSSSCQATGDNFGNLGVYTVAGTYVYTLTVGGASYGPYTVTLGGTGGGGGGISVVNTPSGSGLTNTITGGGSILTIGLETDCGLNQVLVWNGSKWTCANSPVVWSDLISPAQNLNLNLFDSLGVAYTSTFNCGDFGASPTNCVRYNGGGTSASDKSYVLDVEVPATSYQHALNISIDGFQQFQVASLGGASHLGTTIVGNIIPAASLSTTSRSKLWVLAGSPGDSPLTVYQNSTNSAATMFRMNNATSYSGGANPFNFWTACAGAPPNADGTCGTGTILASLRGDGTLNAFNYTGPINGVTISGTPSVGWVPTATSPTTATWQAGGGGGGGTGAQWQSAYFSAINTVAGYGPGKTGQFPISQGASAAPLFASGGVPGSTVSAGTYTVQCDSSTATIDRLNIIKLTAATPTITIPDPADSGCGSNFAFTLLAASGVTATVNRETAATFSTFDGSTALSAQTTFTLTAGQSARFNSPDNTNYNVVIAKGGTGGSPLWSGIQNPNANLTLSMGTNTTTFNHTSAVNWLWANTTTATNATTNASPVLNIAANYWTGAASAADTWSLGSSLAAGTNGASTLTLGHSGSSGTAAVSVPDLIVANSTAHYDMQAEAGGKVVYVSPSTAGLCKMSNGTSADPSYQTCPAGATAFPITVSGGVSGGFPYFSNSTTLSASAAGTINTLVKWGGAGAQPGASSITDAGTTIVAAEGFQFSGSSGAATTISTQANANLILAPNGTGTTVFNNGTATNPAITFAASATFGLYSASATNIALGTGSSAHDALNLTSAGFVRSLSGGAFVFSSSATDATTAADTGISRSAADVVAIGNGTQADTSGKVKAAAYISAGTTFTTNGGCSETSLTGGASAGAFTIGANGCSVVVTMGNSAAAPHGWACWANDQTTANVTQASAGMRQTATGSTTATFTLGTVPQVSDVIVFSCTGY
jgi:hypothetical protein